MSTTTLSLLLILLTLSLSHETNAKQILNDTQPEMAKFYLDIFNDILIPRNLSFDPRSDDYMEALDGSGLPFFIAGGVVFFLSLSVPLCVGCLGMSSRMGMFPFFDRPKVCAFVGSALGFVVVAAVGVAVFYSLVSSYYLYVIEVDGFSSWIAGTVNGSLNVTEVIESNAIELGFNGSVVDAVSDLKDYLVVFANETHNLDVACLRDQETRYYGFIVGYFFIFFFCLCILISVVTFFKGCVKSITFCSLAIAGILLLTTGVIIPLAIFSTQFCEDPYTSVQQIIPPGSSTNYEYYINCNNSELNPFGALEKQVKQEIERNATRKSELEALLLNIDSMNCNGTFDIPFKGLSPETQYFPTSFNSLFKYESDIICIHAVNNFGLMLSEILAVLFGCVMLFIVGCFPFPDNKYRVVH
eukprot:TRINITY_DN3520_c0_g1_i1.p1 TRINITY_DN3520_c0_g1~~TRINITY_DN3520_c0_g1_i1.p1  ORF type:complete len:414 (-),score=71.85 TRINITY_DN3520_c0_g1_i1:36-1277(-)